MGNDRDNSHASTSGVGTLASIICLGVGAVAGWWLANKIEEEKQKEDPQRASRTKPKTCKFETTCVICCEDFSETEKNVVLGCAHHLHEKCFKKLVKKECPICRAKFI